MDAVTMKYMAQYTQQELARSRGHRRWWTIFNGK